VASWKRRWGSLRLAWRARSRIEIKRRIRAVGAFPDRASALRLITAVALRVTETWGGRRHLDMSLLAVRKEVDKAA